ncbi:MAG: tellurite resistance TerB family protein [Polyangiaceae bacterium]|nr:tellurite resistance TerB family protein [Polyangiaceae bacterium]
MPNLADVDDPKLEAIIEAMLLAAHADGEFSDEERAHFSASVESLTDRRVSGERLQALLARIEASVAAEGALARLRGLKDRLPTPRLRETALELAVRLMAADGIVRTSERELILDAADALEIDRDRAADLVKSVTG